MEIADVERFLFRSARASFHLGRLFFDAAGMVFQCADPPFRGAWPNL